MTEILTKDDLDIFRGEHPDTRPASEWWKIVQSKRPKITAQLTIYNPFPISKKCRICNSEFKPKVANQVTCSKSCKRINQLANMAKRYKHIEKPICRCKICGNEFRAKSKTNKTCSRECSAKLSRQNTILWNAANRLKSK